MAMWSYSDLRMFQEGLKQELLIDEFVIAGNGYTDEPASSPQGQIIVSILYCPKFVPGIKF